jgi:hypothetical protein
MAQDIPFINGVQHSWASMRANILGRTVTGISKIDYSDDKEIVNLYGAGSEVTHRGEGNYMAKASVELAGFEVNAIQKAAATNGFSRIQDIPEFDIVVTYLPIGQTRVVTDVIRNCRFKTNARSLSQGDTEIKVPLELVVSDIEWNKI